MKSQVLPLADELAGANFSGDRLYRWCLWRRWGKEKPACFLMLNPSTGNEVILDPTLRRCVGFARAWGCGGIEIVNLFGIVSSNPKVLVKHPDPVGSLNDATILMCATRASVIIVAWGAFPEARERAVKVTKMLLDVGVRLQCLGTTKEGHPNHPLYLPKSTWPIDWSAPS